MQTRLVSNGRLAAPQCQSDVADRGADRRKLTKTTKRIGSPEIPTTHREPVPRGAAHRKNERAHASYFMTGMTYSATLRIPVGQRAVIVFMRV